MVQERVLEDLEEQNVNNEEIRQNFLFKYLRKLPGVSGVVTLVTKLVQKHKAFVKKHSIYQRTLDFLFSSFVGRALSIASAISLFVFSPLGLAFSIVILSSTFFSIALGVSADAFRIYAAKINLNKIEMCSELKQIRAQQIEKINQLHNPQHAEAIKKKLQLERNIPVVVNRGFNPFRTLFKMLTGKIPESTATLVGTIISGDPISTVLGIISSSYSVVSEGVYQKDLDKMNLEIRNKTNRELAHLGVQKANGTNQRALNAIQQVILNERLKLEVLKGVADRLSLAPDFDLGKIDGLVDEIKASMSRAPTSSNKRETPGFLSCVGEAFTKQFSARSMYDAVEYNSNNYKLVQGTELGQGPPPVQAIDGVSYVQETPFIRNQSEKNQSERNQSVVKRINQQGAMKVR
ncbi:hypothetical protein Cyrtocomes_00829 [Candidatus Cyrtobacter comes]|uniref:Uncharacterized protein n=1 Tax=Candidatus Cyrtobacter comes TaxID=675776 RepID=A0ABU5L8J7_9RICK|nr:hypothetical protein [Candidatus Cyrtobacter comes]MDZ5762446.1 hypothetical protein [Candidatus Cyrtobacter comes]